MINFLYNQLINNQFEFENFIVKDQERLLEVINSFFNNMSEEMPNKC